MGTAHRQKIVFRCMAFPSIEGGRSGYSAVCIDLTLATWRPTYKEARRSLQEAVHGYVETVCATATREEQTDLRRALLRPAPFWPYRLQYHAIRIFHWLPNSSSRPNKPKVFTQQFPNLAFPVAA